MSTMSDLSITFDDHAFEVEHVARELRVFVIVRSVARSGMSRVMDFYTSDGAGDMIRITSLMADLGIGVWTRERDGVRISGCGMDMAWHSVYVLSRYMEEVGIISTHDGGGVGNALNVRVL